MAVQLKITVARNGGHMQNVETFTYVDEAKKRIQVLTDELTHNGYKQIEDVFGGLNFKNARGDRATLLLSPI